MFMNVEEAPAYLTTTGASVSTDSFYWTSRMIAALADAHHAEIIPAIERYQQRTLALGHAAVHAATAAASSADDAAVPSLLAEANRRSLSRSAPRRTRSWARSSRLRPRT